MFDSIIEDTIADATGRWRNLLGGVEGRDRVAVEELLRVLARETALLQTAVPGQVQRHKDNIAHAVNALRSIAARKGYEAETEAKAFLLAVATRLVEAAVQVVK